MRKAVYFRQSGTKPPAYHIPVITEALNQTVRGKYNKVKSLLIQESKTLDSLMGPVQSSPKNFIQHVAWQQSQ